MTWIQANTLVRRITSIHNAIFIHFAFTLATNETAEIMDVALALHVCRSIHQAISIITFPVLGRRMSLL